MSVRSMLSLMSITALSDLVVSVSLCPTLHWSGLENKTPNVLAASITRFHNNPGILRGYVCQEFLILSDKIVSVEFFMMLNRNYSRDYTE